MYHSRGVRERHHHRRHPHLRVEREPGEPVGHHADHDEGSLVQRDGPLQDGRIAPEPIAPQRAADDRHGVAVGHRIFLGQERPAERGRCTEKREIARRHEFALHANRLGSNPHGQVRRIEPGHVHQRLVHGPPVAHFGEGAAAGNSLRAEDARQHDEPIGLRERQRPQHGSVEQAEHHRARPDPDRQGQDDRQGVAGTLDQRAKGNRELLKHDGLRSRVFGLRCLRVSGLGSHVSGVFKTKPKTQDQRPFNDPAVRMPGFSAKRPGKPSGCGQRDSRSGTSAGDDVPASTSV